MPARTRILATLGPASWAEETIEELAHAGASAFRLNFSHGRHDELRRAVALVRAVSQRVGRPLALLGDLSGPKLRTGEVHGQDGAPVVLQNGARVRMSPDAPHTDQGMIKVDDAVFRSSLGPGGQVLLDDGKIELRIVELEGREAVAEVVVGGPVGRQKGINLPGVKLDIPAMTEKDRVDLEFAIEQDLDFIALSFVQTARDVVDLKRRIAERGKDIPVISKIEKPIAVRDIDSILEVCDGIMVARGDLGVEIGPEVLPVVQKELIAEARRKGKLVITATQMLESMTQNPRPTRAEASDVANAIMDGSDAVMLSGETAVGSYPVETVRTMTRIIDSVENSRIYNARRAIFARPDREEGVALAAVQAACVAGEQLNARAVVPFTTSGWTAFACAAWRPNVPIIACTPLESTWRRMALCWGSTPLVIPRAPDIDQMNIAGVDALVRSELVRKGDLVVVLSGSVVGGAGANTIRLYQVGTGDLTDDIQARDTLQRIAMDGRNRM